MFVTKKALPRRTFLQAIGATVALPFLDAMVPALSAQRLKPTPRFGFVYVANGVIQDQWKPTTVGAGFELSPILQPLAGVKDHVTILSGLSHLQADTFGDGTGDHPRASAVWLTGVHAYDRTQPGVEVQLATTADQMIANARRADLAASRRSSWPWTSPRRAPAIPATASTSTRSRGGTPRRPTPPRRTRASSSSGCSATAAAPRRGRPALRSQGSILDSVRAEIGRVTASLGRRRQDEAGRVLRVGARDRAAHPERRVAAAGHRAARAAARASRSGSTSTPS